MNIIIVILSTLLNFHVSSGFFCPTTPTRRIAEAAVSDSLSESDLLLYQEQENLLVKRGELESEMLQNAQPLQASTVKVRGAGRAGGFGAASSASHTKSSLKAEAKAHAKTLKKEGVVRIDKVLSPDTADRVREYLYSLRKRSEAEIEAGTVLPIHRFSNVLLKKDRCDLKIPFVITDDDENDGFVVYTALNEALRKSAVGQTIASILSENAILHELSCLMSDPGSQRQVLHPDTPFLAEVGPVLYTCFIALQDVRMDMGPTTWLPRTHTLEAHESFKNNKDSLIQTSPAVLGLLPKGSCAIFDSRCLHCGTANKSKNDGDSRALFYFSFKNPNVGYPGNPPSIIKELGAAQLTIKVLEQELENIYSSKGGKGRSDLFDKIANDMI